MAKSSDDFTIPQDDVTPVGKPGAVGLSQKVDRSDPDARKISGIDFSALQDDSDADDIMAAGDGRITDPKVQRDSARFVLVKFINAPEYPKVNYVLWKNGMQITFLRGRWMLARYCDVATARTNGTLDFAHNPGAEVMKAMANHPVFQIQELPDWIKTTDDVLKFKAQAEKVRGKPLPLATEVM